MLWIISIPLLAAQFPAQPARLTFFDFVGAALWLIGFFFEAVGDAQLVRFKANPANKGKIMTSGVWRYTRHPNYFGDAAQWWGYFLIAAAAGGWWTVYSPIAHDPAAAARLRRGAAGKNHVRQARLRGLHAPDQRLRALAAEEVT